MSKEIVLKQNSPISAEVIDALVSSVTGVSLFNQGANFRRKRNFTVTVMEFAEPNCKGTTISCQPWNLDEPLFELRPISDKGDLFQIKAYYTESGSLTTNIFDVSGTNQIEILEPGDFWLVAFEQTEVVRQTARGGKSKMVTFEFKKG